MNSCDLEWAESWWTRKRQILIHLKNVNWSSKRKISWLLDLSMGQSFPVPIMQIHRSFHTHTHTPPSWPPSPPSLLPHIHNSLFPPASLLDSLPSPSSLIQWIFFFFYRSHFSPLFIFPPFPFNLLLPPPPSSPLNRHGSDAFAKTHTASPDALSGDETQRNSD